MTDDFIAPGDRIDGRRPQGALVVERYGSHAVIVAAAQTAPVLIADWLAAQRIAGVESIVTGEQWTVATTTDSTYAAALFAHLCEVDPGPFDIAPGTSPRPEMAIEVRFDGPDLAAVGEATGLHTDEIVALITGATLEVAFCGFTAGFGYLRGLPPSLHVARRATPRTRVPAGSVAIAAGYAGIYPRRSPGGWHLIGSTDAVIWDIDRRPPGLLVPGALIRFEAAS